MFDKFLCKHIQKSEISLLDVLGWMYGGCKFIWVALFLLAFYVFRTTLITAGVVFVVCAVGCIHHDIVIGIPTDGFWNIFNKENAFNGFLIIIAGLLITLLVSFIWGRIMKLLNMKIAHCQNKEDGE